MSEKTPRQLSQEAQALRSDSRRIEECLANDLEQLDEYLDEVEYNDKIAAGDESERLAEDTNSAEQARDLSQRDRELINDTLQPRINMANEALVMSTQKATEHYEKNAAGYHELGVLEAAMDGVHIETEQPTHEITTAEKTPRQLGREAVALRAWSSRYEDKVERALNAVDFHQGWADYYDQIASGDDSERMDGDITSAERARKLSQESREQMVNVHRPDLELASKVSADLAQKAAEHYKQNAAGYHDLAVLEAALDGVHINVQQSKVMEEHTRTE